VAANTINRESFTTASWNTAGTKQIPSCYAHAAKVGFTPFMHMKHGRHEVRFGVKINEPRKALLI
jgi:hypothetical protein